MANWLDKLRNRSAKRQKRDDYYLSVLKKLVTGSFYKVSDLRGETSLSNIRTQIDTMRALAQDSQIATALSYYATDATTPNTSGQIIWATSIEDKYKEVADIVNAKFKEWNVNTYARDHILEIATTGNLYLPTTSMYREEGETSRKLVSLDNNTIVNDDYEIVASSKLLPEDTVHLWYHGKPAGYAYQPDDQSSAVIQYNENDIIHFTLGGLLGEFTIGGKDSNGNDITYDIQFGTPLMAAAAQPTQTLSLLEDASVLSSLTRIVRFISVECGNAEEEEIQATLQQLKDMIEQQLSINTATGDAQNYVNPQSPNNLIYLPKINGQEPVSITDMNMAESTDADNKLLEYYQNKKLSVLGIPKEAMNFSSAEGLGGAGAVMSQRSALYANSLQRIETAYIEGWTTAMNKYFIEHNIPGMVDKFQLHMNPIITQMSTVNFERRDSALTQATTVTELLKSLGITDESPYKKALTEILTEGFPDTAGDVNSWKVDLASEGGEEEL